jgi:hypothetical protein
MYAKDVRMTGRRDEVQQSMHSVVSGPRVSLDPGFFSEDLVVLPLEIGRDFLEAVVAHQSHRVQDMYK